MTNTLLAALESAEWFARVGQTSESGPRATFLEREIGNPEICPVASWEEALSLASAAEWGNANLEAMNRLRNRIWPISQPRICQWNEVAQEIRAAVDPLVARKLDGVSGIPSFPPIPRALIRANLIGCCLESENSDLVPPSFFHVVAYWLLQGHYPCGWNGEFPGGELLLF